MLYVRRSSLSDVMAKFRINLFLPYVLFSLIIVRYNETVPLNHDENSPANCASLNQMFQSKNISGLLERPISGEKLKVCQAKETCCTQEMENRLKSLVKKDYQAILEHRVMSAQGVIAATAIYFQVYIHHMMSKAGNKTLKVFNDLFDNTSVSANSTVNRFYDQLNQYLADRTNMDDFTISTTSSSSSAATPTVITNADQSKATMDYDVGVSGGGSSSSKLSEVTNDFFTQLFPLVYQFNLTAGSKYREFHPEYRACLEQRMNEIKPFGEPAKILEKDIAKTLEAAKILIAALNFGVEVLNQNNRLVTADASVYDEACYRALLKMSYCSKCNGHPLSVKPCSGYCLNVMHGCLVPYSSELDGPWNGYYEALDKLISVINTGQSAISLEDLLTDLHSRIAEAVMMFRSQNQNVHNKVKYSCGQVRWLNNSDNGVGDMKQSANGAGDITGATVTTKVPASYPAWNTEDEEDDDDDDLDLRSDLLSTKVKLFKDSVPKSSGFYGKLANILCFDESYAETSESAKCWNGQRIGDYATPIVSNTVSSQKYNPEIPWSSTNSTDPRITQLADKLRRVRQIVLSQVSLNPESDSFNQMGSEEGSGGNNPIDLPENDGYNDDDEDSIPDQGSGSGDVPLSNENSAILNNTNAGVNTRILAEPPQLPVDIGGDGAGRSTIRDTKIGVSDKLPPANGPPPASTGFTARISVATIFYCVSFTSCYHYYYYSIFQSNILRNFY